MTTDEIKRAIMQHVRSRLRKYRSKRFLEKDCQRWYASGARIVAAYARVGLIDYEPGEWFPDMRELRWRKRICKALRELTDERKLVALVDDTGKSKYLKLPSSKDEPTRVNMWEDPDINPPQMFDTFRREGIRYAFSWDESQPFEPERQTV